MKKYLCLLILLLFYSCTKEETNFITLSCNEAIFSWSKSEKELTIDTNASWHISPNLPFWITVSSMQGKSGSTNLIVTVSDNDTGQLRFCIITFITSNGEKQLQIIQNAKEKLCFIGNKRYRINHSTTTLSVDIDQNVEYELIIRTKADDWIKQVNTDGGVDEIMPSMPIDNQTTTNHSTGILGNSTIDLEIAENQKLNERYAEVVLYNEQFNLSDTLCITQEGRNENAPYWDGEYLCIQQSTKGNGVSLIIMGDGFIQQEMALNGRYEMIMKQTADHFFSIEPFKSYRDYFNIYMVIAESEEAGVGTENYSGSTVNNKFKTTFGNGTEITCNADLCFEYARKIKELPSNKPLTIIMPLNSTKYAGTTYLYANGNSIALCPMSEEASPNDFEGLIHHEAGGHGFGFLCDEYIYYKQKMPESRKKDLKEWQKLGFQMNLAFTNDLSTILWKDFIGIEKYSQAGAYEGGYEYQYGVWRSEANSCMNNNIPYFNVQSRWSIVSRIMKLAEINNFTIQDFISSDHTTSLNRTTIYSNTSGITILPPLGCPKWIK